MTLLSDAIARGPLTSRPAAGSAGRLWYDTTNSQLTRDSGTAWEICEPVGSGSLPWVNVRDHGATGNGTTDDTTAVSNAIAALPSTGGVLYFPAGTYKTSGGFTISVPCLVLGDGAGSFDNAQYVSEITCTSATAVLFTVTAKWARFENISLANTAGLSVSAGAGIQVSGTYLEQQVDYEGCWFGGFWINVDVQVGGQWSMHGCMNIAAAKYGLKIRNTVNGDAGDWSISDCNFSAEFFDSDAAIRIESSGGGKIVNTKVNMALDGKKFNHGIDLAVAASVATSDLLISNCSIENVRGNGINMTTSAGTSTWDHIIINGIQIVVGNTTGNAIKASATTAGDLAYLVISECVLAGASASTASPIALTNVQNALISGIVTRLFGTPTVSQTTCSGITDASTPFTSLAASGQPKLSSDVTLAAGANVTLTQAGQTITVAASGGGGGSGVTYSETVLGSTVTLNTSGWTDVVSLVLSAGTYVLDADCEMHFTAAAASGAVQLINGAGTPLCGRGISQSPSAGSFPVHLRREIVTTGETVKVQGKLATGSTGTIQPDDGVFGGTTGSILTALKIA